jgi:hypothetical protein
MLIFIEQGRLGNQLFQYAALATLKGQQRLYLIGFDDLFATFDGIDARKFGRSRSFLHRLLFVYRSRLDAFFRLSKIVGTIAEEYSDAGGSPKVKVTSGLLPGIHYGIEAYYQSADQFCQRAIEGLRLRESLVNWASTRANSWRSGDRQLVFVHVRRSDYLVFPDPEFPAVIPGSWYVRCMEELRRHLRNPLFIIVSDDRAYVEGQFGGVEDSVIADGTSSEDFALMCHCDAGILSPSSYSWWAAFFAVQRHPAGIFLAPRFWMGHRRATWLPRGIDADHLTFRDVW